MSVIRYRDRALVKVTVIVRIPVSVARLICSGFALAMVRTSSVMRLFVRGHGSLVGTLGVRWRTVGGAESTPRVGSRAGDVLGASHIGRQATGNGSTGTRSWPHVPTHASAAVLRGSCGLCGG
jgi:hypothetical protein